MGFARKGRNPTGNELPNVSEGQTLRPSHINQIVAAADRATIKGGKGYKFVQTSGGTSLQIDRQNNHTPWSVFTYGENLCINSGNVWGKGLGQKPLHTTRAWGGVNPDPSKKFWTARPVMIGVTGANLVGTDEINGELAGEASNIIQMPLLAGYYYIEYAKWEGRDDKSATGVGDTLKDTSQFILKHSTELATSDEAVVICYVSNEKQAYQAAMGDIWWGLIADDGQPFKISVRKVGEDYRAFLTAGRVNNQKVLYETGGYVGDKDADGLYVGSETELQVVLQLDYEDGSPFPAPEPQVYTLPIDEDITNTDDTAYVLIGTITSTNEGSGGEQRTVIEIEQLVSGSLWVERFKCGEGDAIYWVTKI
jgi:hypothetical protein